MFMSLILYRSWGSFEFQFAGRIFGGLHFHAFRESSLDVLTCAEFLAVQFFVYIN